MAIDRTGKLPRRAGRPPDPRKIGRIGEAAFKLLCADAGVTHQMVEQDDYGWDAIVEFDPVTPPFGSADLRPSVQMAKVQIKTTTTASRSIPFKLSNLVIYAKDARPTFLVLNVAEILRYIGWIKAHLARAGETVEGLVIAARGEDKLHYALSAVSSVSFKSYEVEFRLNDGPSFEEFSRP
jgi:hypothetical protein